MKISSVSQLGLRMEDIRVQVDFMTLLKDDIDWTINWLTDITGEKNRVDDQHVRVQVEDETQANLIENIFKGDNVIGRIKEAIGAINCVDNKGAKFFFICETVYRAAELIKVNTGFTGRTMKDIHPGKYVYLMGKNKTVKFTCNKGAILGFYYDDLNKIAFEFGLEIQSGGYYFSPKHQKIFTDIMQVLIFVELGDIEVKMIEAGRDNGRTRKDGKLLNCSNNTVYVVDSTWNQIIIRTEGFAVRGHFRLQPCGVGMADRKLIWISAFEKHGYQRRPKGEIVD
jgi:hypothetical protein